MIVYDVRTNEWKDADVDDIRYLPPELYFEIKESADGKEHHVFATDKGTKEIVSESKKEFLDEYRKLKEGCSFIVRKEWHLPSESFRLGCETYGINL